MADETDPGRRIIIELDNNGSLAAIALNSPKVFHCQLIFFRPMSTAITTMRLW